MFWVTIIVIAAVIYALGAFVDNYLVDTHFKKINSAVIVFFGIITSLVIMGGVALFSGVDSVLAGLDGRLWYLCLLSGIFDTVGYVMYFRALKGEEATGVTIMGQLSPLFAMIISVLFVGEVFKTSDFLSFALIFGAVALIVLSKKVRGKINLKSGLLMMVAAIFWAGSNVLFRYSVSEDAYFTGLFWIQAGIFISVVVAFMLIPGWFKAVRVYLKKGKRTSRTLLNLGARSISEIGNFIQRYAFVLAPVAVVSATKNVLMLIFVFFFGLLFSKISPKFGREKLTRRSVIMHFTAMVMAALGIVLLTF
jgi:drug/metabolite transporter (DMT)-like permease